MPSAHSVFPIVPRDVCLILIFSSQLKCHTAERLPSPPCANWLSQFHSITHCTIISFLGNNNFQFSCLFICLHVYCEITHVNISLLRWRFHLYWSVFCIPKLSCNSCHAPALLIKGNGLETLYATRCKQEEFCSQRMQQETFEMFWNLKSWRQTITGTFASSYTTDVTVTSGVRWLIWRIYLK